MSTELKNTVLTTLRPFEISDDRRSSFMYFFTVATLILSAATSSLVYSINPWLSSLFWLPSGILLCRFFVMQHDCGHNSFFRSVKTNQLAGTVLGFFTMIPGILWKHIHNVHHGTLGNLDKRKINPELWTLTVREYQDAPVIKKVAYRLMRSTFMRLVVTPALWMVGPRIPLPHLGYKILISTILHNVIYGVIFYYLAIYNLLWAAVVVYLIPIYLFNFMASIMFYLQHQYEDTVWEDEKNWDYFTASINGSSYVKVGRFMRWLTGNVGCHHVHHLNTRIPSYELAIATEKIESLMYVEPIYLKDLFHHLNCALWDEQQKKLISFKSYHKKYQDR